MTTDFNVTGLKYGKYDITNEKMNNNKRLIDRAREYVPMKKVTQNSKFKILKIWENISD